jgi:two-component system, OmpR family, alkaline phosphatase synthesis response regulator PhoP
VEKVLVIDDDQSIATLLKYNLGKAGFNVIASCDGFEGLNSVRKEEPDLILLARLLPGFDGLELCKSLRMEKNDTPILIITAEDNEIDRIIGLEIGADDYIIKPMDPREVVARVKAVLRRTKSIICPQKLDLQEEVYRIGPLRIDPNGYKVELYSKKLDLTRTEFVILLYLAKHRGKAVKREHLLRAIQGIRPTQNPRIVDTHIYHLRKKIEVDPEHPKFIRTVRGLGYIFA